MSLKRKSDHKLQTHFRSDRLFEHEGKWFFYTRESTIEGPYPDQQEARQQIKAYIKKMMALETTVSTELALEPMG